MAGDWIKVEHTTPDKPEVVKLAEILHMDDPDFVLGKLWRFWAWADANTQDGILKTKYAHIDRVVYCPGFARGLVSVGWLQGREGALVIPNFDRHNGNSSKARALEAEAKRIRRSLKDQSDNVSDMASDKSPTPCPTVVRHNVRPEKRREENNNIGENTAYSRQRALPEDSDKVKAYLQAEALRGRLLLNESQINELSMLFYADKEACGWVDAKGNPINNWQAAALAYALRYAENRRGTPSPSTTTPGRRTYGY